MAAAGLVQKWTKDEKVKVEVSRGNDEKGTIGAITIKHLQAAYFFLLLGYILSVLAFLLEWLKHNWDLRLVSNRDTPLAANHSSPFTTDHMVGYTTNNTTLHHPTQLTTPPYTTDNTTLHKLPHHPTNQPHHPTS
ncbi:hypothetical protein Pcinc_004553 [Petrolisthes cinctipes]|nr:hypothetical protein Pcinc_004553 [Petrolisthes cinctipes]